MLSLALLGAESSGKTQLAQALAQHALQLGWHVNLLEEPLREWCAQNGRTPLSHEQTALAHAHNKLLHAAVNAGRQSPHKHLLIADTSPLQTAAYSAHYFSDRSLDAWALAQHAQLFDLSLLMGLDLGWQADPGQRSGPDSQAPVDAQLRRLLQATDRGFTVIYGRGAQRLDQAWRAVLALQGQYATYPSYPTYPASPAAQAAQAFDGTELPGTSQSPTSQRWRRPCECCADIASERALFSRLMKPSHEAPPAPATDASLPR